MTGKILTILLLAVVLLAALACWLLLWMTSMPGESWTGEAPPLSPAEDEVRAGLERYVRDLAGDIGERNYRYHRQLTQAAEYIADTFRTLGLEPGAQDYQIVSRIYRNVFAEIPGTTMPGEIIVVGAHYDSVAGAPGADDNGSGMASMLEIARLLRHRPLPRTVRFVAFVNEEEPFFMTNEQGSYVYARACRRRGDRITAMLSLECFGYYRNEAGSQRVPFPVNHFYPVTGNFVAFVGNVASARLVRRAIGTFRRTTPFPSQGAGLPGIIPGVSWSDQRSFWMHGYQAFMVTDTAFYRNPHYHTRSDLPDTLDYPSLARITLGLSRVVAELAGDEGEPAAK